MRPWSMIVLEIAFISGREVSPLGLRYVFSTDKRLGSGCLCDDQAAFQPNGVVASQTAWLHGNAVRNSKADMQSDWLNRTACCTSHTKHNWASL